MLMDYKQILPRARENRVSFGLMMNLKDPTIVEMAGLVGYDFIRVDAEHNVFSLNEICSIVRAADSVGLPVIVRYIDIEDFTPLVDFGVAGFLIPHVQDGEQARRIVNILKYAPVGRRGYTSAGRAQRYGYTDIQTYRNERAKDVIVMVQIEDQSGIEHMEEIISTPGVDMVCSGRGDIAQALGLFGQTSHPDVVAVERRIVELAKKHGKLCQFYTHNPAHVEEYITQGVRVITLKSDMDMLMNGMKKSIADASAFRNSFYTKEGIED